MEGNRGLCLRQPESHSVYLARAPVPSNGANPSYPFNSEFGEFCLLLRQEARQHHPHRLAVMIFVALREIADLMIGVQCEAENLSLVADWCPQKKY